MYSRAFEARRPPVGAALDRLEPLSLCLGRAAPFQYRQSSDGAAMGDVMIGVIGGSGLYEIDGLEDARVAARSRRPGARPRTRS